MIEAFEFSATSEAVVFYEGYSILGNALVPGIRAWFTLEKV